MISADEDVLGEDNHGVANGKHHLVEASDGGACLGAGRFVWFLRLPAGRVLRWRCQPESIERGHSGSEGELTEGKRSVLPWGSAGSSRTLRWTILSGKKQEPPQEDDLIPQALARPPLLAATRSHARRFRCS